MQMKTVLHICSAREFNSSGWTALVAPGITATATLVALAVTAPVTVAAAASSVATTSGSETVVPSNSAGTQSAGTKAGVATGHAARNPGSDLFNEVEVIQQVRALGLTPEQVPTIAQRLAWLRQARTTHTRKVDTAGAPVAPALNKLSADLFLGKTVPADVETPVHTALAPLDPEGLQLQAYEEKSVAAIRAVLNRRQIRLIQQMLDGPPGETGQAQSPGGGAAPGPAGGFGGGAGRPVAGIPGAPVAGAPGQNPIPRRRRRGGGFAGFMDRMRSMSDTDFTNLMQRMGSRYSRRMGYAPGSADAQAAEMQLQNQFQQMRQMPQAQYQAQRGDLARQLRGQLRGNAAGANGGVNGGGANGAANGSSGAPVNPRQLSEDSLVRRFFLRPGVLPYLVNTAARMSARRSATALRHTP